MKLATNLCIALGVLLVSASYAGSDSTQYGEKLSGSTTLRITELLENPAPFLGQKITIEGLVEDVCPMKGCWIDVQDKETTDKIRFKVEDGVIEFPTEARGKAVVAEGVLRKHELNREQAVAYLRHLAEEKGETFDEASVEGPLTLFQLEGLGAEVSPGD